MPPVAQAFQAAGGWRDREERKMMKLATGSHIVAVLVPSESLQVQAQSQAPTQVPATTDAGTLKPPELVRTPIP
jgi:hypothetical protein